MPGFLAVLVSAVLSVATVAGPAPVPAAADSAPLADAAAPRTALFFGDSYFVGGGCSPDPSRGMAALAGIELGYTPVIRGAGGTGFVSANPEYGIPPYLQQIADGALDADNPALVLIEGGSNDYDHPIKRIRRNAGKVLSIARNKYPDAVLVLAGPMQTYGDFSISNGIKRSLRSLARKRGIPFINMQKWTYGHDDYLCSDYIHPTYDGHVILGHRLAAALAKRGG